MNVILTGFMGTGKSSVGKLLARLLGFRYVDLDCRIVEKEGASINDIFRLKGEPYFRSVETEAARETAGESGLVISTGGGAVLAPENRRIFREQGVIVNLIASAEEICSRLKGCDDRPLLKDDSSLQKVEAMLQAREACYADADIRIDTTGKKVEDVAQEIARKLKETGTFGNRTRRA